MFHNLSVFIPIISGKKKKEITSNIKQNGRDEKSAKMCGIFKGDTEHVTTI